MIRSPIAIISQRYVTVALEYSIPASPPCLTIARPTLVPTGNPIEIRNVWDSLGLLPPKSETRLNLHHCCRQ